MLRFSRLKTRHNRLAVSLRTTHTDERHSDYLREQAARYLDLAKKEENSLAKKEFLELAGICEEVANDMDDRRVSG